MIKKTKSNKSNRLNLFNDNIQNILLFILVILIVYFISRWCRSKEKFFDTRCDGCYNIIQLNRDNDEFIIYTESSDMRKYIS